MFQQYVNAILYYLNENIPVTVRSCSTVLVIIGELMFLSGTDTVISLQGDLEVKAGLMLLAIVINGFLFSQVRRLSERIERLMVCCVFQSTPF